MDDILCNIEPDWIAVLHEVTLLNAVCKRLFRQDVSRMCPPPAKWFEFARLTPYKDIKVVIIGQDPYHTPGLAHGLAFSSLGEIPPSLRNIFKCLVSCGLLPNMPSTANLTPWANQGVLLINGALSTMQGRPKAHMKTWEPYVDHVITRIAADHEAQGHKLIFMLWGAFAHTYKDILCDYNHVVMCWKHPSPLAQSGSGKPFIECDHFQRATDMAGICWALEAPAEPVVRKYKDGYKPKWFNSIGHTHVAFTDGSCVGNGTKGAVAGYAAVFVDGPFVNTLLMGNVKAKPSNIRAEGMAIYDAIERMLEDPNLVHGCVVTDSEFWINMIEKHMPMWPPEKFKEMANPDLTTALWSIWNKTGAATIELRHVRSHQKVTKPGYDKYCAEQNNYADALAKYAREALPPGTKKRDVVPYD
jgi:uracil-DNA glycosylase